MIDFMEANEYTLKVNSEYWMLKRMSTHRTLPFREEAAGESLWREMKKLSWSPHCKRDECAAFIIRVVPRKLSFRPLLG
jgi:hypothetical protein